MKPTLTQRRLFGPAIWVRADRELIDYFKDRQAWLVEADETPPTVSPYNTSP